VPGIRGRAHDQSVKDEARTHIAHTLGLDRKTLYRWVEAGRWALAPNAHMQQVTVASVAKVAQAQVIDEMAYAVVEHAINDGTVKELADLAVRVGRRHLTLAHLMNQAVLQFREDIATGELTPLQIVGFKTFIWGAQQAIMAGRAAMGRREGEPSMETDFDPNQGLGLMVQTLEPRAVQVNDGGRALEDTP
jgi:hypothetical protein